MYFDTIRLWGDSNIDLPIFGANPTSPFVLKNADGLGPPDINVSIFQDVNLNGVYQSSIPVGREVVLRIGLNPNYVTNETVADLRAQLYNFISIEDQVITYELRLMASGSVVAVTQGKVKKFEVIPFSKDPEVQITFACFSPFFESLDPLLLDPGISLTTPNLHNPGNAPTGFVMVANITSDSSNFEVRNPDESKVIRVNHSFETGDLLIIDTRPGNRSIRIIRHPGSPGEFTIDLIGYLTSTSEWITLKPGDNIMHIIPGLATFSWESIYFWPRYWGV